MSVVQALDFMKNLQLDPMRAEIARLVIKEIVSRLTFLKDVGLEYLTLDRLAGTLSGGEAQRIRLATQIGSQLTGVLYVLDEPSIGLHQRDNARLIKTLKNMRDLGNSLIVVEHDEETMMESDWIVDIGPGAGVHGGEVIASGTPQEVMQCENSITGQYLSGRKKIDVPTKRRKGNGLFLEIKGAQENNLKNVNVKFPLGTLTVVTGVSGSGKSSLVNEILCKAVQHSLGRTRIKPGKHKAILGLENIDKVIEISQDPIGRTRVPIRSLTPGCSMISAICLPRRRKRSCAAMTRGAFPQCPRRPLRSMSGRRCEAHFDALSAGRLRTVRGMPWQALQ